MCMGRATKKLSFFMEQYKEYIGTIRLGEVTSTMDAESKIEEVKKWSHLTGMHAKWNDALIRCAHDVTKGL